MILSFLIAFDQLVNTLVYVRGDGWGTPDETLSARAFRIEIQGGTSQFRRAIDALFFWQDHHCFCAWRSEIDRSHLPSHYRIED